jgi:transcriptional regulator of acetoin/glycerol metabolism
MAYSNSWERFVEGGDVSGVRLPVAASWNRSAAAMADPAGRGVIHEEYDPEDVLARAARRVLKASEDALSNTTTWVALANSRGAVTYEWASTSELKHKLARADVSVGAVLDEGRVGTNGVGLALATRSLSLVNGTEHYNMNWHNLVCAASPLVHPISGDLLGVVNITSLVDEQNQHLKITLNAVVSAIRESLARGLRTRHQRLLDAHLRVKRAVSGTVATLDDHVMIVEEKSGFAVPERELLWPLVERAGAAATELALPGGDRVRLIPVDRSDISLGCSLIFTNHEHVLRRPIGLIPADARTPLGPIEQAEYEVILAVLRETQGNKSEAAARLQISRGTLYERIRRYGIVEP